MKKILLWILPAIVLLSVTAGAFAEEILIWSNFNDDPVKSGPEYAAGIPIKADTDPVLLTRIRTYHRNSGDGAVPGTISVYDGDEPAGTWQAAVQSADGGENVYWEAAAELLLLPGHTYRVKVSDNSGWNFNEASKNCGMFELYGEWPAPEGYVPGAADSGSEAPSEETPAPDAAVQAAVPSGESVPPEEPGGVYYFGNYEQNNNTADGAEPIEWLVLDVQDGKALLLSKKILDAKSYTDMRTGKTWEMSELRRWLNIQFYGTAFTQDERKKISKVTNRIPDNTVYGTKGGNSTADMIFLLSAEEAQQYFSTDEARAAEPTAYTAAQDPGVYPGVNSTSLWYLRTPGIMAGINALVGNNGAVEYGGPLCESGCDKVRFGMRPALWLKLPKKLHVTYDGNNCLAAVPSDDNIYEPDDKVAVLFSPVEYISGKIFAGWDWNGDGRADFDYTYDSFTMPEKNVELKAICYGSY